jgi:hypothetical protein
MPGHARPHGLSEAAGGTCDQQSVEHEVSSNMLCAHRAKLELIIQVAGFASTSRV